MTGSDVKSDDQTVDTDIFVIVENENEYYGFVTVDEDTSYDAVVIDMSQDDFADVITVNFDEDASTDLFVSIDEEDQVFTSDFTADDLLFDIDLK